MIFGKSRFDRLLSLLVLILLLLAGCSSTPLFPIPGLQPAAPEQLIPKIISTSPHDTSSFTEGLVWYDGLLYESAGLYGKSNLRKVDPETGQVLQRLDDPAQVFGEGLALEGNHLVQLTWHEGIAYLYDLDTFVQTGTFSYEGEGWGLCFDGQRFYMTDGSAGISVRDAKTFAVTGKLQVAQDGKPVTMLNELECVGDSLYANVWKTNEILRLDKATGRITAVIDASGLLTPQETAAAGTEGVLNGIAYDPADNTFLITGKLWPKMFEVRFVPKNSDRPSLFPLILHASLTVWSTIGKP
jgi:glutaminyl-peptide cyclotransferase